MQLLTILLEEPTDDSVEIAVNFTKEIGQVTVAIFYTPPPFPLSDVGSSTCTKLRIVITVGDG